MTRSRYVVATLLQYFGVRRKAKRMTDAAFELHLMQDGEEILGALSWENIENIEELSMEYWNLRRLAKERKAIQARIQEAEVVLADAQKARIASRDSNQDAGQELFDERDDLFEKIEDFNKQRDVIMAGAAQTKKKHSALKMKVKVLQSEGLTDGPQIEESRSELAQLRQVFTEDKEKLVQINEEAKRLEAQLDLVQEKIRDEISDSKGVVARAFEQISIANRDITKYQAEMGLIQEEQTALHREVGRFLNLNAKRSDCRAACKKNRGIQQQINLLYRSIDLNRKLVERLG